jgi:hypothetical protein
MDLRRVLLLSAILYSPPPPQILLLNIIIYFYSDGLEWEMGVAVFAGWLVHGGIRR